jgi:hypothetical protein
MDQSYIQIDRLDQYLAAYGHRWPDRAALEALTASLATVVVDGWKQEGWVYFLPGGQQGPADQVGMIVVVSGGVSLPARICRENVTREQWGALQERMGFGQEFREFQFDEFLQLLNRP